MRDPMSPALWDPLKIASEKKCPYCVQRIYLTSLNT